MQHIKDNLIKYYAYFAGAFVIFIISYLFYFIFSQGIAYINWDFLSQNPAGNILGEAGGIRNAIIGSFLLMLLAMFFSALLGISCALYRQVYCEINILKIILKFIIQSMASIPSILLGLFVYALFIVNLDIPKSLLTASFTLALMVFPFVEISVEKVIGELDRNLLRDSFALGVDKTYMCRKLILPAIKKNVLSISLLAGSYAIGATAPLLLTGVVYMASPNGLLSPIMALPFHLHMLLNQSVSTNNAYATALILIFILILLHLLSAFIANNIGGKLVRYINNRKS